MFRKPRSMNSLTNADFGFWWAFARSSNRAARVGGIFNEIVIMPPLYYFDGIEAIPQSSTASPRHRSVKALQAIEGFGI